MASTQTILVPTDFSPTSQFAVDHAAAQASITDARLLIVHVFPVSSSDRGEGMLYDGLRDKDVATAEQRLRAIKPDAAIQFEHRLLQGDPAEEILQLAQSEKADLIVLGTHGRTGLMRVLMGSVAERVLREATCPVLAVKVPTAPAS